MQSVEQWRDPKPDQQQVVVLQPAAKYLGYKVGDFPVDLESGKTPDYTAHMDDRFIAHFENRWYQGNHAVISYVVRAAYSTEAQIGDAHVEHMYAPEIYGRSNVARAVVLEK